MKYRTLKGFVALALAFVISFLSPEMALAQVPSIQYVLPAQIQTYRASISGLTAAASATDFFTIQGAAGRQIRINFMKCSGVSTGSATAILNVIKRSTLDTGGTSTSPAAVRLNSTNGAALATVKAYTVNPSALGTSIGQVDAGYLSTDTLASSVFSNAGLRFDFTNQNLFINDATTQVALNANAASFSSGTSLDCTIEWSEQ